MIEIINLDEVIPENILEGVTEGAMQTLLFRIAEAARAEWSRLAGKEFFTTRRDYQRGIQPVAYSFGIATISLVGVLPNLLENGMPAMQMHDVLLGPNVPTVPRGQKGAHKSKDGGRYRAIPFRHAGASSGGAVGQPMGRAYSGHSLVSDAKALGRHVHAAAKALEKPTVGAPGGALKYGDRLAAGTTYKTGRGKKRKTLSVPKLREWHSTDIYAGMIRSSKHYEEAKQNQYATFRTIAVDANGQPRVKDARSWYRKETKGKKLAKKVQAFIAEIAPKTFQAYVDGLTIK